MALPAILLSILLLSFTPSGAHESKLELRLNNVTHAVIDPASLQIDTKNIPLQSLFPYLDSVDYLEAKSRQDIVFWNASSLGPSGWNEAFLTFRNQTLELRVGTDNFAAPQRISVHGIRKTIKVVRIWSSVQNPQYKSKLLAALAPRDVKVEWKDISKPANRLRFPPQGMPHLVIVDQLQMLRLDSLLTSPRPIAAKSSRWYSSPPGDANGGRIAIDAYHPESALLYLLADNPNLLDKHNKLPDSLITFLNRIIMSDDLVATPHPMAALVNSAGSQVTGSVRLPSSREKVDDVLVETKPPTGATNIIRYSHAAIPADISGEQREIARLVLEDAARLADLSVPANAVAIPRHPRIPRFFDAYTRIGRLAISNQIPAAKAAELINAYVSED